jgi:hypothetical protein
VKESLMPYVDRTGLEVLERREYCLAADSAHDIGRRHGRCLGEGWEAGGQFHAQTIRRNPLRAMPPFVPSRRDVRPSSRKSHPGTV